MDITEKAVILCNQKKYKEAIDLLKTNKNIALSITETEKLNPPLSENRIFLSLGESFRQISNIVLAVKLFKHSEKFAREIDDLSLLSDSLHQLGVIHKENFQDFNIARDYYVEALDIRKQIGDKAQIAASLHEIGIINQFSGEFDEAMIKYEESLSLSFELLDLFQMGNTIAQIGRIHHQHKDYNVSAQKYSVAYNIMKRIESPNISVISEWISELRDSMSEMEFNNSWNRAIEDKYLQALDEVEFCRLCKMRIYSESYKGLVRGAWCPQPDEHYRIWWDSFMAFSNEVSLLRSAEKALNIRERNPLSIRIYFDYDKWLKYNEWLEEESQSRDLPITFQDLRNFFDVEDLDSDSPDTVTFWS